MKYVLGFLAFIGAVFLVLIFTIAVLFAWNSKAFDRETSPLGEDDVRPVLNWAGQNGSQDFELIWAERQTHPFMDDFAASYCLKLKEFRHSENSSWTLRSTEDEFLKNLRNTTLGFSFNLGWNQTCVEDSDDLMMFVRRAEYRDGGISGWEVMFFDPESKRFHYRGWQT